MTKILSVTEFGGGVTLEGSVEAKHVNELQACDSLQIGTRGQLQLLSDTTDYVLIKDKNGTPAPLLYVYGLGLGTFGTQTVLLAVGLGQNASGTFFIYFAHLLPTGETSPLSATNVLPAAAAGAVSVASGFVATFVPFPFVDLNGTQQYPLLCNVGVRENQMPKQFGGGLATGLYILTAPGGTYNIDPMSQYDALGTGPVPMTKGDPPAGTGTHAVNLNFRGIAVYNTHVFGWGFDNSDTTNGNGPNRLMWSNPANPFIWGNDNNGTAGTDRAFADSDAIIVGGGGEIIRGAYDYKGRLWIGTNRQLHWLSGDGRDSFAQNTSSVLQSENVVSANAMTEGPDGLLYGVSTTGLWQLQVLMYGNTAIERPYQKLYDYRGRSPGYWDMIWFDPTRSDGYPGKTNYDLIWVYSDPIAQDVCVVIPYCSIANGFGFGMDTIVIRYNTRSGGFTRQCFPSRVYTAGLHMRPQSTTLGGTFFAGGSAGASTTVQKYGDTGSQGVAIPTTPQSLPTWTHGPYAPFGADGSGVMRRAYAVFAWEVASPNIAWDVTLVVDDATIDTLTVNINSGAPTVIHDGDYWLDVSGTIDTNIGNAAAGSLIPATHSWVYKRWQASTSQWVNVPGAGGQKGQRATLPIDFHNQTRGTRVAVTFTQRAGAGGFRYEVEGFGVAPALVQEALLG